ncbi:MAG TPA: YetF domain-containing protein [Steroidobacteraceae bacterium]|nr:YetF domain-containing protein [Steroidobacteraceae bacterium]
MTLLDVFGVTNHIEWWQELPRAFVVFVFGLVLLRISGRRTFARWSALDIIVSIIMGSSLSRALTGSAPLGGTLLAMILIAFLHWVLARAASRSPRFAHLVEGRAVILGESGNVLPREMQRYNISQTDMQEALRKEGIADPGQTRQVTLEPSGTITVLTA